ncbi:unnamed protein product, partial [Mesorhabditis spiculigera]
MSNASGAADYTEFQSRLRELGGDQLDLERIRQCVADVTDCQIATVTPGWRKKLQRHVINPLEKIKLAVIVVDFQNDFVDGSLSLKAGDSGENPDDAVCPINTLLSEQEIDLVVYTFDWHPENHISFFDHRHDEDRQLAAEERDREPSLFDCVSFAKPVCKQVLYPSHCVQNSDGAKLDSRIRVVDNAEMIYKGTDVLTDSYSAFFDNAKQGRTHLEEALRAKDINALLVCGLAYDICVAATLKDAAELGFLAAAVTDCSKGFSQDGITKAHNDFEKLNIPRMCLEDAQKVVRRQAIPTEWILNLIAQAGTATD